MATHHAIDAVGRTIVNRLEGATHEEFTGADFALYRTEDFQRPMETGVSVYLYRVAAARMARLPPAVDPGGGRRPPPLALSLHYLLTAWGNDAASEQRLLAWAMRVLEDTPVLPSALLNMTSAGAFSENETVELALEELSLTDTVNLWRGLHCSYRPGVSYTARAIMIDSPAANRKEGT